jgi:Mce-associated membrane protein
MIDQEYKDDAAESDAATGPAASDAQPESDAASASAANDAQPESETAASEASLSESNGDNLDDGEEPDAKTKSTTSAQARRRVSVSVRTLLFTALVVALLGAIGTLSWLYLGAKAKLDNETRQASSNAHAERIALDYAVDAAKINFQDLNTWSAHLVKGTTPELKEKLNSAAKSMEQILEPLQWNSTAVPLAAKVRSSANGIYVVDTFVGVETKTMQAPDGLQSTATYSITIDSAHDWQISDVGGIGSVVGRK